LDWFGLRFYFWIGSIWILLTCIALWDTTLSSDQLQIFILQFFQSASWMFDTWKTKFQRLGLKNVNFTYLGLLFVNLSGSHTLLFPDFVMSSLFAVWTHTLCLSAISSHTVYWLKQKATPFRSASFRRHISKNSNN
jgi:hypothetical protein